MAVRRLAPADVQPKHFAFTAENEQWARGQIGKYPEGRQASAVIPLLWRAQEQAGGWVPEAAIRYVAEFLGMAQIRVLEVATFYTMFNLEPVGRRHVQWCGTTPCLLRGGGDIKDACERRIGHQHHVTSDGQFSWVEVECLGACVNAPVVQIGSDFYEDLTAESFNRILDEFAAGGYPKPGPQVDRQFSAPVGGPITLTDSSLYEGGNGRPASGTGDHSGPALSDDAAKKAGEPANVRDAPIPKPPAGDAADGSSTRRE